VDVAECTGFDADQRGQPRPVDVSIIINATGGDGCDIGAYEAQFDPVLTKTVGLDSTECATTSTIILDGEGSERRRTESCKRPWIANFTRF
jgi:hypothetical protein